MSEVKKQAKKSPMVLTGKRNEGKTKKSARRREFFWGNKKGRGA